MLHFAVSTVGSKVDENLVKRTVNAHVFNRCVHHFAVNCLCKVYKYNSTVRISNTNIAVDNLCPVSAYIGGIQLGFR
ncbi:hypothetical protein D3C84_595190 [compost metagenome]